MRLSVLEILYYIGACIDQWGGGGISLPLPLSPSPASGLHSLASLASGIHQTMINTIPNTSIPLPSPWDLLFTGLSTGDYIRDRHGDDAYQAWVGAGSPVYSEPVADWAAKDVGIMRRGWGGYYRR